MANIRPLHDRVILKRVKEEEKTKGGIIIPTLRRRSRLEGEVVCCRNGKILEDGTVRKLDVKVGDRVLFGKYSGTEVKVDGEESTDPARGRHPRRSREVVRPPACRERVKVNGCQGNRLHGKRKEI